MKVIILPPIDFDKPIKVRVYEGKGLGLVSPNPNPNPNGKIGLKLIQTLTPF